MRDHSQRIDFDRGFVGDELRRRIQAVYGGPNEVIVGLLEVLQSRYGGLTYHSGFFRADIEFTPVCEPRRPDRELEIRYAVQTEGVVGASVKGDGSVEVGLNDADVIEFDGLDALIECDALFHEAEGFAARSEIKVPVSGFRAVIASLDAALSRIPAAGGTHTHWFSGDSALVYVSDL